jgi:hypothetical protein
MIQMHRHSKYTIIIFIFVLAIIVGLKTSNLISIIDGPQPVKEDKQINEMFNALKYYRKVTLNFKSNTIDPIRLEIVKLSADPQINQINSQAANDSYFSLLEVSNISFKDYYNKIIQIKGFVQEKIINHQPDYDINIDEHINNKEMAKLQLQALLKHSAIPERVELYNQQLENIQAEIDSLHNLKMVQEKFKNNTLMYIQVTKETVRVEQIISALKRFGIYTFASLVLLVIFFTILYFILNNLLKLMKAMGIRTSSSSSSYYYSPKKKKIKRKYKESNEE